MNYVNSQANDRRQKHKINDRKFPEMTHLKHSMEKVSKILFPFKLQKR